MWSDYIDYQKTNNEYSKEEIGKNEEKLWYNVYHVFAYKKEKWIY